jgi:hypothetical protein
VWVERLMMSTFAAPVTTFFGSSTNRPVAHSGQRSLDVPLAVELGQSILGSLADQGRLRAASTP